MDRVAGVRYFEGGAQHKRGIPMGRPYAIVLSSVLATVACATTVPIDLSELLAVTDGGRVDAGFAGFGGGNPGSGSEFGGFPTATGGSPFVSFTGGAPNPSPPPSTGGRSPGPTRGTGGRTTMPAPTPPPTSMPPLATGGRSATGAGGATSSGGATSGGCRDTEKVCGGVCVSPGPRTGCGLTGCDPCSITAPTGGVVICNGSHQCDVSCLSGYTKNGNTCEAPPPPAPGTSTGSCPSSAVGCPDCGPVFGPGCCSTVNTGKCGCSPVPWTLGILGCI